MSFLQMLRSDVDSRWTADDLEALLNSAEAVAELNTRVTSLLDVSRLESREMPVTLASVDVAELLPRSLEGTQALEGFDRLRVDPPPSGLMLLADLDLTTRVIRNLARTGATTC